MYPVAHKEEGVAFYRVCSYCGSALDPGERCDCQDKEKAAPVLQHRDGQKVESESPNPHSTSIVQQNKGGNQE